VPIIGDGTPTVANTTGSFVNGRPGNDTISLDERSGPLPAGKLADGSGNDINIGESSDDTISGGAGDDVLVGGAGDHMFRLIPASWIPATTSSRGRPAPTPSGSFSARSPTTTSTSRPTAGGSESPVS
jgi:hypothetical protein